MLNPLPVLSLLHTAMQEYGQQCHADKEKTAGSDEVPNVEASEEKEKELANSSTSNAKMHKSRKLISTCTNVEPWLLDRFPLDSREVVIAHVIHKTNMLPHFQITGSALDHLEYVFCWWVRSFPSNASHFLSISCIFDIFIRQLYNKGLLAVLLTIRSCLSRT